MNFIISCSNQVIISLVRSGPAVDNIAGHRLLGGKTGNRHCRLLCKAQDDRVLGPLPKEDQQGIQRLHCYSHPKQTMIDKLSTKFMIPQAGGFAAM